MIDMTRPARSRPSGRRRVPPRHPGQHHQRTRAGAYRRSDWNYFGTHRCLLEETTVIGGALAASEADIVVAEEDPMITAPVQLVGKLVVGVAGRPHLRARPRRRMSARWITFVRNRNLPDLAIAGPAAGIFPKTTRG